ncbi:MAG: imidazolonepropionase [Deltaproteobacteria bacterium]|nr:MAG: imidazolonepropionase [Deltaproteobacteria bacterium]
MSVAFVLHRAAKVLTLAGPQRPRRGREMSDLCILEDASVAVDEDGRIAWVGSAHNLDVPGDPEIVDCRGKTILPAFVDAHTHLVYAGDRKDELEMRLSGADYEAIFAAGGGILASVRATRSADEDALVTATRSRIRRMLRAGTTTFEIKSGYGLEPATELRQLAAARRLAREDGLRIRTTCLAAHAFPEDVRDGRRTADDFVSEICETILPAAVREGLADYADVFCDRGAFSVEQARRVLARAKELGLGLRVHANELGPTGGARLAAELGALTADHLLFVDDDDRRALARAGVTAVLLPGTSLVLGKPFADGRALIEAGVPVAVATDSNPGSCALENLGLVLALACYGNRLSPAEAIVAATHNAACTLGLAHEVGRVEPTMAADLLVLDTDDPRDLVYHAGSPLAWAVYCRGRRVDRLDEAAKS